VLAANQISNLDGVAVGCALFPRQVRWLGKAELFKPLLAPVLRGIGVIPVRRGEGDVEALATAVRLAKSGQAVGIFPEGTRRKKGLRKKRLARPHVGAARIALAAGVPLVPAAIAGTERITLLRRWSVAFGPPVSVEDLDGNRRLAARDLTRRLMDAIAELEAELVGERSPAPHRLYPRHRLDVSAADLLFALAAAVVARRRGREERVLRSWAGGGRGLVCLSVRTGFDLLLQALALQPGDEVAVSAVTHPDMVRIVEAHGLRALPVDIDPSTLAPRVEALERAIGPRTRMILLAHLFGSRVDLTSIRALADRYDLVVVEDCAQSLRGPSDAGDPMADVSLFSFGSIKTATALGGALVRVDDAALRERIRGLAAGLPVQRRAAHARRAVRFLGLVALQQPRVYALFARGLAAFGADLDAVVNGAVRGFPADKLLPSIRRRPSAPLLALLERRLRRFDSVRLRERAAAGDRLAASLSRVERPGSAALDRTYWVFPVVVSSPARVVASLRRAGFDASTKTSAISVVAAPADRPDLVPESAERLLGELVFLPAYPRIGDDVDRLAEAVEP
jgi:dTDP-4-amino-4,6-dideoxygalactose transaminase